MTSTLNAITLTSYPFRDRSKIIKVYSKQKGLLTLLIKGVHQKNTEKISVCSPLTLSEITYKEGKDSLHLFLDVTLLDLHMQVRNTFNSIHSALEMCKTLLQTQQLEKPSEMLFNLFALYLKKVSQGIFPKQYELSFKLKVLYHEGKVYLTPHCSICSGSSTSLYGGESFCKLHAPSEAIYMTKKDFEIIHTLTYSRKLSEIEDVSFSKELEKKICVFYESMLD